MSLSLTRPTVSSIVQVYYGYRVYALSLSKSLSLTIALVCTRVHTVFKYSTSLNARTRLPFFKVALALSQVPEHT